MVISSRDNPKIKLFKKLLQSRKSRDESGLFVAEGMRGCIDIIKCGEKGLVSITAVLYTAEAIERYRGQLPVELAENFDESRRYVITSEIAEKISETGSSQGIFVVAHKLDKKLSEGCIKHDGKYLVLCGIQDPGNLGTMLRTGDALGIDGVIMTGNSVDLYNPKAVRSAVGSMPKINLYVENDFSRVIDILKKVGIKTCAAVVRGGESVCGFDFSGGCAVVIGNEGRGLSDENAVLCDRKITIEMKGSLDSLNAATAGTILLWEMCRRS